MRRFRRGFRRSRSTWAYADSELVQVNSGGQVSFTWLLPPGRTSYLCDTDRVSALTYMGSHLWLDFSWVNTGAQTGIPDVTFYAIVSDLVESGTTPSNLLYQPWHQPPLPSAITSWDENDEYDDGTQAFLWTHHIKGASPPNAQVATFGNTSPNSADNQPGFISASSGVDAPVQLCRKFHVAAEWQPDVIIKSRRRLKKDQGVLFVMSADVAITSSVNCQLVVRSRTLVKRGR